MRPVFESLLCLSANLMLIWLAIYPNRARIVRWICRRKVANGQHRSAEAIINGARADHWINYMQELALRTEFELPWDGEPFPDEAGKIPNPFKHLAELVRFYIPWRSK
jgi:hypothetical protein